MATTAVVNPLSELAGGNSFQESREPGGTWVVGKPENTEPTKVGSDHVRAWKDEMTEFQEEDWFCSISPESYCSLLFFLHRGVQVPEWAETNRVPPEVKWGCIIEFWCVLLLNSLTWTRSLVQRVQCFRTKTASGPKTWCLWKSHSPLYHFLSRGCVHLQWWQLCSGWGFQPMQAALQVTLRKRRGDEPLSKRGHWGN